MDENSKSSISNLLVLELGIETKSKPYRSLIDLKNATAHLAAHTSEGREAFRLCDSM